jgi:hypothetical protein
MHGGYMVLLAKCITTTHKGNFIFDFIHVYLYFGRFLNIIYMKMVEHQFYNKKLHVVR